MEKVAAINHLSVAQRRGTVFYRTERKALGLRQYVGASQRPFDLVVKGRARELVEWFGAARRMTGNTSNGFDSACPLPEQTQIQAGPVIDKLG